MLKIYYYIYEWCFAVLYSVYVIKFKQYTLAFGYDELTRSYLYPVLKYLF